MMFKSVEEQVCQIWKEVLSLDAVAAGDSFFELGGDSLQAVDVVYRLRERGFMLTIGDFIANPTLHDICALVAAPATARSAA